MRKFILSVCTAFALVMLLASCGAQKKSSAGVAGSSSVGNDGPTAREWRNGLKGTWVLNSVDRENIPSAYTIKNVFDEAPVDCFIGSEWHLPGGNYQGSISFNASGSLCADGAVRTIVWTVYDGANEGLHPQFQLKKLYAGEKARNVTTGYRMDLSYSDGQSLVMRMPIPLDDGTGNLVFNFTRVQD